MCNKILSNGLKNTNRFMMHKSLTKFSQIYDNATPIEIKELLPYFIDHITFTPQEIKIALFDQPTDKGLFVNHSDKCAPEFSDWLPDQCTQRTQNRLTIHFPIHIIFNRHKGLDIIEGDAPYKISTNDRITKTLLRRFAPVRCKPNPIRIAQKYKQIYNRLSPPTMTQVAKEFGISRVRVCQMLNLLKLDQQIIDYLSNITDPKENNFWTERKLRRLLRIEKKEQLKCFQNYSLSDNPT